MQHTFPSHASQLSEETRSDPSKMLLYGNLEDVDTAYTLRCFTILSVVILISLLGVTLITDYQNTSVSPKAINQWAQK